MQKISFYAISTVDISTTHNFNLLHFHLSAISNSTNFSYLVLIRLSYYLSAIASNESNSLSYWSLFTKKSKRFKTGVKISIFKFEMYEKENHIK